MSRAVVVVLEKMVNEKKTVSGAPTLTSTAVIESVMQKYREGLVTEKSLSEAMESSVNRLEHSGTSELELGAEPTGPAAVQGSAKTQKKKAAVQQALQSFRLGEVDAHNVNVQEVLLKACTPAYATLTPLDIEMKVEATLVAASNKQPVLIDLEEEEAVTEETACKKPRLSGMDEPFPTGRWLQLREIDAKIWMEN